MTTPSKPRRWTLGTARIDGGPLKWFVINPFNNINSTLPEDAQVVESSALDAAEREIKSLSESFDEMNDLANTSFANGLKVGAEERDALRAEVENLKAEIPMYHHPKYVMASKNTELREENAALKAKLKVAEHVLYGASVCFNCEGCRKLANDAIDKLREEKEVRGE